ncbi:hypothetical protein ACIBK8_25595 [Streptomyces sp. NPDC050161]|uniref:hypothetical protein n=1 Tax=Streptomyces sp. NPDC050161 TaxID=3365604 RepID=UPI0037AE0372
MAVIDHHDVVIGSTEGMHTFVVVNARIASAHSLLVKGGFTAREQQGRTVYLLPSPPPPSWPPSRSESALHWLQAETPDVVDFRALARGRSRFAPVGARFDLSGRRFTASASTALAREELERSGFRPTTPTGYELPASSSERDDLDSVLRAESRLWYRGQLRSTFSLGIATPDAIPPAPRSTPAPAPLPPGAPQPQGRSR